MISPNDRSIDLEAQETYWRSRLGSDVRALQLYLDHPRPPVPAFQRAHVSQDLDLHLCQRINNLCERTNSTLDVFLLASFATLLFRYTDQGDFIVSSLSSDSLWWLDSQTPETFTNPVALCVNLRGDPSFVAFLDRVALNLRDTATYRDYPFEKIQHDRNIQQANISRIMFVLVGIPTLISAEPISEDHLDDCAEYINQSDLVFLFAPTAESFTVTCQYDAELFEPTTIHGLLDHYRTLLQGVVAQPEARLSQLPLLAELERKQLVIEWNDTKTDYPKDQCIHQLFEAQVEKTPDAVAVVFEDQELTYRELNERANQLAHYLRGRGVTPETLVALCMERSLEMVIGILGIVKAGGAYLPIDPDSPKDRLRFMLEDAKAPFLLTQEKFSPRLVELGDQRICVDSLRSDLLLESKNNPDHQVKDQNAVYVIYTSGSTGAPKGVINVHGGLRNRLQWMQEAYRLTPEDRVLQKTPFTFDVSVWEFFWPLISGACLVIARPQGHRDSAYLVQLIQSRQITLLHFVPSMLRVFLQQAGVESCTTLRQVVCSGEALSWELQKRFFECTGAALDNLYGPTEASIDVTAWRCRSDSNLGSVPIGRPIANTRIYILDGNLNPVPVGVVGEIYIGGDGVARGYLNRPELTAQRFIPDPFSSSPGAYLYRTGDLARFLPDGNILFLGRTDHQVKIRGYRIELGEIETLLAQHPAVKESVVSAREDTPDDLRLVAYVVGTANSGPSADELRRFLRQKLPDYMVPSAFVSLDSLPLSPSGKLDRKALPAPDHSRPAQQTYLPPSSPQEKLLAQIWSDVLKLDQVGVHDNFFDLGGHSLLATQLISRVRDAFEVDLPLRCLFENPTIFGIAERVQEFGASQGVLQETKISRVGRAQYRVQSKT